MVEQCPNCGSNSIRVFASNIFMDFNRLCYKCGTWFHPELSSQWTPWLTQAVEPMRLPNDPGAWLFRRRKQAPWELTSVRVPKEMQNIPGEWVPFQPPIVREREREPTAKEDAEWLRRFITVSGYQCASAINAEERKRLDRIADRLDREGGE